jgi:CTP:molybdopterin cytidylyltransferase MocA
LHCYCQMQRTTNSIHKISRLLLGGDARSVSAAPASTSLRRPSENEAVLKALNHEVLVVKSRRETRGWESFERRPSENLPTRWVPAPPIAAGCRPVVLLPLADIRSSINQGFFKGRGVPSIPDIHPAAMASLRTVCRAPLSQLARRTAATNHPRILQRQWRGYATSLEAQQKVT